MTNFQHTKNALGEEGSPILPDNIKNYLIDIDGTICDDIPNEEIEKMRTANEIAGAKEKLNKWYDEGHIITFFTARLEAQREVTEIWLKEHGFKYHGIILNKPRGGNYHWIDDRKVESTFFTGNWDNIK